MARYRRNYDNNHPNREYSMAFRRMKRIKGFYTHLVIYLLFNTIIIVVNRNEVTQSGANFWSWQTFSTTFFWGIGLLAHGFSVYGRDLFFSKNWEERKIQEFMNNDKKEKWE